MTYKGVDSANAPNTEVLDKFKPEFWGGYVGGAGASRVWLAEDWQFLKDHNIKPLPIYVPLQNCSEVPETLAADAIKACEAIGLTGVIAFDSEASMRPVMNHGAFLERISVAVRAKGWKYIQYTGADYLPKDSYAWLPKWNNKPQELDKEACHQYENYDASATVNVDLDEAGENFPFAEWLTDEEKASEGTETDTVPKAHVPQAGIYSVTCPNCGQAMEIELMKESTK